MTLQNTIGHIKLKHPHKSICVEKIIWWHNGYECGEPRYKISILPGFNLTECQFFEGATLVECIDAINAFVSPPSVNDINNE